MPRCTSASARGRPCRAHLVAGGRARGRGDILGLLLVAGALARARARVGAVARGRAAGRRALAHALAGLLALLGARLGLGRHGRLGLQVRQQRRAVLGRARLQLAQPGARRAFC